MQRRMLVALFLATLAVGPASAQDNERGGVRTETQDRAARGASTYDLIWNLVGLIGLLGLLGLHTEHDEDSYHPAPIE
jgi:hypothetical protein